MTLFLWFVVAVAASALLAVCIAMWKTKHPLKALGTSAATGFLALAAVNVIGGFTGVSLGLGWVSVGACTFFGLPGVGMLLFLKSIFLL